MFDPDPGFDADDPCSTDVPLGFVTLAGCLPRPGHSPMKGPSLAPQARRRMVSSVTSPASPGLVPTLACVFRPGWRFLTKLREDSGGGFPGGPNCFCRESAVVWAWTHRRRPRAAGGSVSRLSCFYREFTGGRSADHIFTLYVKHVYVNRYLARTTDRAPESGKRSAGRRRGYARCARPRRPGRGRRGRGRARSGRGPGRRGRRRRWGSGSR